MRKSILFVCLSLVAVFTAFGAFGAETQKAEDYPWALLSGVRQSLVEAGPTEAGFTQTYVPAGFSSGEKETGRMFLALPDCMRWDYKDPYPKSFLLCGGVAHSWNTEDKTGRRYRIDRRNEPGLDLLLLGIDDLKTRYRATVKSVPSGNIEVDLIPKEKLAELTDAALTVDPVKKRLVAVSYHDREGNLTRFEIKDYRDLPRRGQFSPPQGIRWEEQ
jgi:outer membrane lipoprotein-sorting protein